MTASGTGRTPGPATGGLPWLLRRVNQRYRSAVRERLDASGFADVTQTGFWALEALARGKADAGQLGTEMRVSKQAVSKVVEALVAGGYVVRSPNERDRRKSDLVLTTRGRQAARAIEQAVALTDRAIEEELGPVEAGRLRELLGRLSEWPSER